MKIPWDEVGAELGPTITEGAIVQHLAKLRNRLADEGVQVTPPLKRGGRINSGAPSSKAGNNNKTVSAKGGVAKRTGTGRSQKQVNKGTCVWCIICPYGISAFTLISLLPLIRQRQPEYGKTD